MPESRLVFSTLTKTLSAAFGNAFFVILHRGACTYDLTTKVKEEQPDVLGNVVPRVLTMWRCTDSEIDFGDMDPDNFNDLLNEVFSPNEEKVKKLSPKQRLRQLTEKTLLIEVPASEGEEDTELSEEARNTPTELGPIMRKRITFFVRLRTSEEADWPGVIGLNGYRMSQLLEDCIRDIVRVPRHPGSAEMRNCLTVIISQSIEPQPYRTRINEMINDNANTANPYSDVNHEVFHFIQAISTVYRSEGTGPDLSQEAAWLLLFEKFTVHFSSETYKITDILHLTTFLFEVYNYARHVQSGCNVGEKGNTVESMKKAIDRERLGTLTGKKDGRNDDGSRDPKRRRTDGDQNRDQNTYHEQIMDALKKANFKVQSIKHDPDLEPMLKLTSHVLEATSSEGVLVVVKLVRIEDSDELSLLEELNAQRSPHNHVIPLMETLEIGLGGFLIILPKKTSISDLSPCILDCESVRLSHQLVEGVAFLHRHKIAHLDIKPDNLVSDSESRCLYIIDFDIAIRCMEIDEMIELSCGTPKWSAPEIAHDNKRSLRPLNPIRADLWSCGAVVAFFGSGKDRAIDSLTGLLLNYEPRRRPLLHELMDEEPDFWSSGRLLQALALARLCFRLSRQQCGDNPVIPAPGPLLQGLRLRPPSSSLWVLQQIPKFEMWLSGILPPNLTHLSTMVKQSSSMKKWIVTKLWQYTTRAMDNAGRLAAVEAAAIAAARIFDQGNSLLMGSGRTYWRAERSLSHVRHQNQDETSLKASYVHGTRLVTPFDNASLFMDYTDFFFSVPVPDNLTLEELDTLCQTNNADGSESWNTFMRQMHAEQ
ncbi:kinase-like protein [Sanghuangporus baumii]|uniref:Kinase-like protein n=1 Tax=Sanghuangporus baumii TaxID=108892 RepID=A0A9Q5NA74_SANBA|nr:kinase-like protein [Sanghuangporus baumii]